MIATTRPPRSALPRAIRPLGRDESSRTVRLAILGLGSCTSITRHSARQSYECRWSWVGSVLERARNQFGAFGNPVLSALLVVLVEREALCLLLARDADYITDEG